MTRQIPSRFRTDSNCSLWVGRRPPHLHAGLRARHAQSTVRGEGRDERLQRPGGPVLMGGCALRFWLPNRLRPLRRPLHSGLLWLNWKMNIITLYSEKQIKAWSRNTSRNPNFCSKHTNWQAIKCKDQCEHQRFSWFQYVQSLTFRRGVVGQSLSVWGLQGHTEPGPAEHQRSAAEEIHNQHTSPSVCTAVWSVSVARFERVKLTRTGLLSSPPTFPSR